MITAARRRVESALAGETPISDLRTEEQAIVNAEVGRRTDPITAATVSFIVGLAVLLVVGTVSGRLQLAEATQLPPLLLTGGLFGVLIVTNGAFNAIGWANTAMWQSAARTFLVMVPFAWVMRAAWGADAIYAGELAANLAGGILAAGLALRIIRAER